MSGRRPSQCPTNSFRIVGSRDRRPAGPHGCGRARAAGRPCRDRQGGRSAAADGRRFSRQTPHRSLPSPDAARPIAATLSRIPPEKLNDDLDRWARPNLSTVSTRRGRLARGIFRRPGFGDLRGGIVELRIDHLGQNGTGKGIGVEARHCYARFQSYRRAHEWTRLMSLRRRAGASAPLAFAP